MSRLHELCSGHVLRAPHGRTAVDVALSLSLYKSLPSCRRRGRNCDPIQSASPEPSPYASAVTCQSPADLLNAEKTYQDFKAAVKRLKWHKAAGVDGIKAAFIMEASA